jgi:hypothetical protein
MWCTKPLRSKVDQDQTHVTEDPFLLGESEPPAVAGG